MRRTVAASAAVLFLRSMRNRNGVIMKQYIIRRVLLTIPLLVAISFVCFALISLIPSEPAEVALRVRQIPVISDEMIAETRAELGLDKPYLIRYLTWVWNVLHGDFSFSYVNPLRSVADELLRGLLATLELAGRRSFSSF